MQPVPREAGCTPHPHARREAGFQEGLEPNSKERLMDEFRVLPWILAGVIALLAWDLVSFGLRVQSTVSRFADPVAMATPKTPLPISCRISGQGGGGGVGLLPVSLQVSARYRDPAGSGPVSAWVNYPAHVRAPFRPLGCGSCAIGRDPHRASVPAQPPVSRMV